MNKEYEKHFKWCTDNGIRIYPTPVSSANTGDYNIIVERNGIGSRGNMIFQDKPTNKNPSVWEQMRTLYRLIYEKESINQLNQE